MLRLERKKTGAVSYRRFGLFEGRNSTTFLLLLAFIAALLLHLFAYLIMKIEPYYVEPSEEKQMQQMMVVELDSELAEAILTQEERQRMADWPAFVVEPLYSQGWEEFLLLDESQIENVRNVKGVRQQRSER